MEIHFNDTVGSIACKNLQAARVLSRHGVDIGGSRSIREACQDANISFRKLSMEIRKAEEYRKCHPGDFSSLGIDKLTRFIEKYYHHVTYENMLFIKVNIARLVRMYGRKHPELEDIQGLFLEMTVHLRIHMEHEDHILFPYIRKLVKGGRKVRTDIFKSVASPIAALEADHDTENRCLKKIDDLTHHYVAREAGCPYFRVTYQALAEFERELHAHMRLESEILFPKARDMESMITMARYHHHD